MRFIRNRLGEPDATGRRAPVPIEGTEFVVKADTVIPAVSQAADNTFLPVESSFEINRGRVTRRPRHVRHQRPRRLRLRRLRDRPDDAHRGRRATARSAPTPSTATCRAGATVDVDANVRIVSSWRHEMPEFYDVLPRDHVPMVQVEARMPSTDPHVNFTTPVERGYTTDQAVTESHALPDVQLQHLVRPASAASCAARAPTSAPRASST